jgi:hypothetical protein
VRPSPIVLEAAQTLERERGCGERLGGTGAPYMGIAGHHEPHDPGARWTANLGFRRGGRGEAQVRADGEGGRCEAPGTSADGLLPTTRRRIRRPPESSSGGEVEAERRRGLEVAVGWRV